MELAKGQFHLRGGIGTNTRMVYFVGAGPGDPELLTIKALKVIKSSDIIVYAGSLVNRRVLRFAKRGAEVHDSSGMSLKEVLGIYKRAAAKNKKVARLHSGDPSIYGAIQEQMDWCRKNNIDFSVIPGVSSFQAAAASLRQELTLPAVSQTVILTRIAGRTAVPKKEALARLARIGSTMAIFLSIDKMDSVVRELKQGYNPDTPVAVIEKVSFKDERRISGTLKDIAEKVKKAGMKRQAIIIVGDILKRKYRLSKLYDEKFEHSFRKAR